MYCHIWCCYSHHRCRLFLPIVEPTVFTILFVILVVNPTVDTNVDPSLALELMRSLRGRLVGEYQSAGAL